MIFVQVTLDVESVVRDILRPHMAGANVRGRVVMESPPGDLPPKYEELGGGIISLSSFFQRKLCLF